MRAWDFTGALSGVLFAVLFMAGSFYSGLWTPEADPNPEMPAETLAAAVAPRLDEAALGARLAAVSAVFLVVFAAYARQRAAAGRWFADAAFGGAALLAAFVLVQASFVLAIAATPAGEADAAIVKTFFVWGWESNVLQASGAVLFVAGSAAALWYADRGIRPIAWAGAVLGVLAVAGSVVVPWMVGMLAAVWALLLGAGLAWVELKDAPAA